MWLELFLLFTTVSVFCDGSKNTSCNFDSSHSHLCGWYLGTSHNCYWNQQRKVHGEKGYLYLKGARECSSTLAWTYSSFDGWANSYLTIEYHVSGPGPFTLKVSDDNNGAHWFCKIQPGNSIKRMAHVFVPGAAGYLYILGKVAKGSKLIITQIWDDLRGVKAQSWCPLLPTTWIPTTRLTTTPSTTTKTSTKRPTTKLIKRPTTRMPKTTKTSTRIRPITTKMSTTIKPITTKMSTRIRPITTKMSTRIRPITTKMSTRIRPITTKTSTTIKPITTKMSTRIRPITTKTSTTITPITTKMSTRIRPITTKMSTRIRPITTKTSTTIKPITTKMSTRIRPITTKMSTRIRPSLSTTLHMATRPITISTMITQMKNISKAMTSQTTTTFKQPGWKSTMNELQSTGAKVIMTTPKEKTGEQSAEPVFPSTLAVNTSIHSFSNISTLRWTNVRELSSSTSTITTENVKIGKSDEQIKKEKNKKAIIGAIVGVLASIIMITVFIFIKKRRKNIPGPLYDQPENRNEVSFENKAYQ